MSRTSHNDASPTAENGSLIENTSSVADLRRRCKQEGLPSIHKWYAMEKQLWLLGCTISPENLKRKHPLFITMGQTKNAQIPLGSEIKLQASRNSINIGSYSYDPFRFRPATNVVENIYRFQMLRPYQTKAFSSISKHRGRKKLLSVKTPKRELCLYRHLLMLVTDISSVCAPRGLRVLRNLLGGRGGGESNENNGKVFTFRP